MVKWDPAKQAPEFSSEHQPARRGRTPKSAKFAGQFAEFDSQSGALFGEALKVYKQVLEGEYLQPMMNNKTGVVEMVGPTADQALKAADAIVNRIMGKAASHKEVDVNIERQDTMVILTGDAAAELRSLRRRNKELEARLAEEPKAIEAGYTEGGPPLDLSAAAQVARYNRLAEEEERRTGEPRSRALAYAPLSPPASAVSAPAVSPAAPAPPVSAAYLLPTDASSPSFSPVPARERKVTPFRAKAEEGSDVD